MTSFTTASKGLPDNTWYFQSEYEAYLTCYEYFSEDSAYVWNGLAKTELERVLNLFEHYNNPTVGPGGNIGQCYFPTRDKFFYYNNYHDPYGSPFYANSRLFAIQPIFKSLPDYEIPLLDMCYCLDSYLGLGYDYIDDNLYFDEHPVNWTINCLWELPLHQKWWVFYHELHVEYGQLITNNPPGPSNK